VDIGSSGSRRRFTAKNATLAVLMMKLGAAYVRPAVCAQINFRRRQHTDERGGEIYPKPDPLARD
jgi:hypothetical protein